MAITKCKECGKDISNKAEHCPHCGVPINTRSNIGCGTIAGFVILLLIIIGSATSIYDSTKPKPVKTAEQIREDQIKKYFDVWDGSHTNLTKVIKDSLNDPKSYQHDKTLYFDRGDHLIVETTFRTKNKYGGMVTYQIKAKTDLSGNVLQIISNKPADKL